MEGVLLFSGARLCMCSVLKYDRGFLSKRVLNIEDSPVFRIVNDLITMVARFFVRWGVIKDNAALLGRGGAWVGPKRESR